MVKNQIIFSMCLWMMVKSACAITLNDFVADVIQGSPEVQQRVHIYRQVVEDENIANGGWLPRVDLSASVGAYKTESPTTGLTERRTGSHNAELTLTQNLFNGYDTTYAETQAYARIQSELYRIYDEADNVAMVAIGYYFDALKQRRLVELAERNVRSHEEILQQLHDRNFAGAGRLSEEEQTIGRLAQAQAGLLAQNNNLQDALTRLHFSLGRYIDIDELETPKIPVLPQLTLDELLQQALVTHPAMESAKYNIQSAQSNYQRSKSHLYPKIDLQLKKLVGEDISGLNGNTDNHSIVLNLTYNLYNGGANNAGERKGLSAVYENREFAFKVKRQIIESVRLSWMAATALHSQIKYLDEYVDKSNSTADVYRVEFIIGKRDLLDLLDIEGEYNTSMVRRSRAYYDGLTEVYRVYEGIGHLFKAMSLDVDLSNNNLRLVKLNSNGIDTLPFNDDEDFDNENNQTDHCDNTLKDHPVNIYGCHASARAEFKFKKIVFDDTKLILGELKRKHLNFVYRSEDLTDKSFAVLNEVIENLRELPIDTTIQVYAHTDSRGGVPYNYDLSQRRADSIKSILILAGFEASRIIAIGIGESEPIAENDTDEGRAMNRRVEFLVEKINKPLDSKNNKQGQSDSDTNQKLEAEQALAVQQALEDQQALEAQLAFEAQQLLEAQQALQKQLALEAQLEKDEESKLAVGELTSKNLNFEYRSDELTEKSFNILKDIVDGILKLPTDTAIHIFAHTDSVGGFTYNKRLSQKRADFVKSVLVNSGVNESRITALGKGELQPIAENESEEGRARNRRVEFLVRNINRVPKTNQSDDAVRVITPQAVENDATLYPINDVPESTLNVPVIDDALIESVVIPVRVLTEEERAAQDIVDAQEDLESKIDVEIEQYIQDQEAEEALEVKRVQDAKLVAEVLEAQRVIEAKKMAEILEVERVQKAKQAAEALEIEREREAKLAAEALEAQHVLEAKEEAAEALEAERMLEAKQAAEAIEIEREKEAKQAAEALEAQRVLEAKEAAEALEAERMLEVKQAAEILEAESVLEAKQAAEALEIVRVQEANLAAEALEAQRVLEVKQASETLEAELVLEAKQAQEAEVEIQESIVSRDKTFELSSETETSDDLTVGRLIQTQLKFVYRSEDLTDESFTLLKDVIDGLIDLPNDTLITVNAHTDNKGWVGSNLRLSQDRAEAIKNLLVLSGVDESRIIAVGKGESEPFATNETAEGRAINRRVDFFVKQIEINISPEAKLEIKQALTAEQVLLETLDAEAKQRQITLDTKQATQSQAEKEADEHLRKGELISTQLNFANRSEELTDESFSILKDTLDMLSEYPTDTTIKVFAHTDSLGESSANNALSQKRADAVKDLLILTGFEASRIIAIGVGEMEPIADNATEEGRAVNRRVEFFVQRLGDK